MMIENNDIMDSLELDSETSYSRNLDTELGEDILEDLTISAESFEVHCDLYDDVALEEDELML